MESFFETLNMAVNSFADYISPDLAFVSAFLSTPILVLQYLVISPIVEFFTNLF